MENAILEVWHVFKMSSFTFRKLGGADGLAVLFCQHTGLGMRVSDVQHMLMSFEGAYLPQKKSC